MALDDATVDNGCLWGVPGSHKAPPNSYMKRKYNEKIKSYETEMERVANSQLDSYSTDGGVPLEVPAGSIVLLHGNFVHYSKKNTSHHK